MNVTVNDMSRAEWTRLSGANAGSLHQDWAYGEALRALGADVTRLVVRDAGAPVALAQMTRRRLAGLVDWGVCSRGPVWIGNPDAAARVETARVLRAAAPLRRPRALFLTLSDTEADARDWTRMARLKRIMTGQCAAMLDLTPDLDGLRASMHGKWRNRLRAGEKREQGGQLRAVRGGAKPAQYRWLLNQEDAQRERVGYRAVPTQLVEAFQSDAKRKDSVRMWRVEQGRETLAAMLFLVHGARAAYHVGWTSAKGRETGAHALTLWAAMTGLKGDGVTALDLGAVDTDRSAGVARFKLGAGAAPVMLAGTFV